jgi:hypothetical protein
LSGRLAAAAGRYGITLSRLALVALARRLRTLGVPVAQIKLLTD